MSVSIMPVEGYKTLCCGCGKPIIVAMGGDYGREAPGMMTQERRDVCTSCYRIVHRLLNLEDPTDAGWWFWWAPGDMVPAFVRAMTEEERKG